MSAREQRATKRNMMTSSEPEEVKVKATKVQKVIKIPSSSQKQKTSTQKVKSSTASASDVILTSATRAITGFASAASAASAEIISSIDYCDYLDTHRQIVIVSASGEQFWPVQNMAFFRTSGTSNDGTEWLRGTFYPTSGLTCKHRDTPDIIRNYAECLKGNRDHVSGHIAKMSDYTTVRGFRVSTPDLFPFMRDLFDGALLPAITRVFPGYPHKQVDDTMLSYPGFGSDIGHKYIFALEATIQNYFLTEEQLKLSYQLTPDNTGLWGFRFGDFSLSEFCRLRWGLLPKFNVPRVETCTPNTDSIYTFIRDNNANIEFDDMQRQVLLLLTPETKENTRTLFFKIINYVGNIRNYEMKYKQLLNKGKGKTRKLKRQKQKQQKQKTRNNKKATKIKKTKAKK
jgi:hypothetical protein